MGGTGARGPVAVWTDRLLYTLSSWSSPKIFGTFLVWFGAWSAAVAVAIETLVSDDDKRELAATSSSVVAALGVLFSFLTGFVITGQWSRSRTAVGAVHSEADACVRLALASETPEIGGAELRRELIAYLRSGVDDEWGTLETHGYRSHPGTPTTRARLDALEQRVRAAAIAPAVRTAVSDELLRAAEGLAIARRYRLNLAGHGLPTPLFVLVFTSGVVLSISAVAIAGARSGVAILVAFGLILLIALDLALILALSDPFRGPMRADAGAMRMVLADLEGERYGQIAPPEPASHQSPSPPT
jgi:hypothetical protein